MEQMEKNNDVELRRAIQIIELERKNYVGIIKPTKPSDGPTFGRSYKAIMRWTMDPMRKLILLQLFEDANSAQGWITWAQNTHADKLGVKRLTIIRHWNDLKKLGILIGHPNNKDKGHAKKYTICMSKLKAEYQTKKNELNYNELCKLIP